MNSALAMKKPNQNYKYPGIGGINSDPYAMNYQENSQGAQGSIGSAGSFSKNNKAIGSRGSDFKLPSVPNKIAMGGM